MHPHEDSVLRPFYEPRGVAVVGSLKDVRGEAYTSIRNMLHFGFSGNIYPINPGYSEVMGIRAYPTVEDVEGPVDLAMVIVPPPAVPEVIEHCGRKGLRAVIVGTEGFAERGEAGARSQQQLVDVARDHGVRLLGPNTIGLVNTSNGLVTAPYWITYDTIRKGNVAYGSQSGFIGAQGLPLEDRAYPISKMCDFGNKCDLNEADLLEYLVDDPETKVISLHIEAVKEGRRFMDALRRVTARKPVLVFKTGRTEQGATAAASHTGSLAGSAQVCNAALRQAGAITVNTWQEMLDIPKVFAMQPLPSGNRVGVVTATGGVGVAAIDGAVQAGLVIARLSGPTVDRLKSLNPSLGRNPVDLGPTMVVAADPFAATEEAVRAVVDDPNVDCCLLVLPSGIDRWATATVEMFGRLRQRTTKPVSVYIYGTSVSVRDDVARQLDALGVPTYLELETAVRALGVAVQYARSKSRLAG